MIKTKSLKKIALIEDDGKTIDVGKTFSELPIEIISCILNFVPYADISQVREVSKRFNMIAQSILNSGFLRLGEDLDRAMLHVKKMLPKRESQRRNHALSKVNEVYSALETRYALLSMTFRKHIDDNSCCFMAGKVLDEAFKVLNFLNGCIERQEQPRETQEMLKDIRDYSSMAMEYFDEEIAPTIRIPDPLNFIYRSRYRHFGPPLKNGRITCSIANSNLPSESFGGYLSPFVDETKIMEWKRCVDEKLKNQDHRIAEQDRLIGEQSRAINCIIECMNQMNSEVSFSFMEELKMFDEKARGVSDEDSSRRSEGKQGSSGLTTIENNRKRITHDPSPSPTKRQCKTDDA